MHAPPSGNGAPAASSDATVSVEPIDLLAWNINRSPNDPATGQLPFVHATLGALSEVELFALSEVDAGWFEGLDRAVDASGRSFGLVGGTTGASIRLAVLFAEDRFEHLGNHELTGVPATSGARAPLVVTLRDLQSGVTFEFAAVHLIRGPRNDPHEANRRRAEEADRIRQAVQRSTLPIILAGDFNLDCPLGSAPVGCAPAFDVLTAEGLIVWHPHVPHADTICSERYDNMLDLFFSARLPAGWSVTASVVSDSRFCSEMAPGAHYPVMARVVPARITP